MARGNVESTWPTMVLGILPNLTSTDVSNDLCGWMRRGTHADDGILEVNENKCGFVEIKLKFCDGTPYFALIGYGLAVNAGIVTATEGPASSSRPGRTIPSFFIRNCRVARCSPSRTAAPLGPTPQLLGQLLVLSHIHCGADNPFQKSQRLTTVQMILSGLFEC